MVSSPILFVCFILPLFPPITFLHGSLWKCTALSFSGASLLKTHTAHKIGIKLICDASFSLISLPYTASAMNFASIKDKTFHLLAQKTYWYSVYWFLITFFFIKMYGSMSLCRFMCAVYMQEPKDATGGHQIPWKWSCQPHGCWDSNLIMCKKRKHS